MKWVIFLSLCSEYDVGERSWPEHPGNWALCKPSAREAKDPGYRLLFSSGFNDGRGNWVYTKPSPTPRNISLCLCSELSLRLSLFGRAIQTFLHLTDFTSIPWSHREIWLLAPAHDVPLFSFSPSLPPSLSLCSPESERSLYNVIMQPCK